MHAWKNPEVPQVAGSAPILELFNTATGNLQATAPADAANTAASMYVCGITPYDATHMGHASTYVTFDLVHRTWLDNGRSVTYTQNITDVDDPLLERAEATGVDWRDLAEQQVQLFRDDMEALNVIPPQNYIGAVESIDWLVPVVEQLLEADLAYRVPAGADGVEGDIYFDTYAAENEAWRLGSVSNYDRETMLGFFAERGGDPQRVGKRDALDPLLWRAAREGEPSWAGGKLGTGRPGWHIECSVIARKTLPAPFTVQGGGSDLIFPHHEFSAAHAAASDHQELAQTYVHTGMVGLDGEKMSKSLGNLVLVSKLRAAGVEPVAIRAVLLSQHYRTNWFWTDELLNLAQQRVASWRERLQGTGLAEATALLASIRSRMANDLDAPGALEAIDHWAAQPADGSSDGEQVLRDGFDALLGLKL
ncbi:cysteine--1-D-myo-inosityl 2-amino-2-deoxy-alpha-D-glucopyranoside ligase [Arthrobacter sp. NIO-1057]|uniref:cysteine--1-D-myo-inosityl 2-amino-2-deoxy-alpha-D-glucopyranoside ligase n=1 Tax=Arthrobacter sp. NIO-1057 TaxID=993071 RepID=UPI00071D4A20|nr:cysteine--1-D-myo-inosityl 2-amino-2-deoxy-alpha-D-glucopyranoside ligase [Arthrobacter sp. NIO-1057]KSU67881.1 cysteine--1-D-myo-inosityl 2-amino-2-deoxy-alpha-D-glucopyranoside ligase [Arthrobacter sp. NIO-1057]SCB81934.1 L-cysteine:1D-myo-inositol 2-amino-2-deoxy-alpha-D-glucopyranoside ligase [Arthrobacter sp. NIO-1057]